MKKFAQVDKIQVMKIKKMPSFVAAVNDVKEERVRAAIDTVNIVAALARKNAQKNISAQFTTRNAFTVNSVRFTQCGKNLKNLNAVKSEAGITDRAAYMVRQEQGGVKRAPNGENLIIPNTRARGGSNANKVRRKYRWDEVSKNIVKWSSRGGSRKARGVAAAYVAAKTGKFVRRNNAIFKVTNFRKTKAGVHYRLSEILNLKHKTTTTPQNKWLEPASEDAAKDMQKIFNSQMDKG